MSICINNMPLGINQDAELALGRINNLIFAKGSDAGIAYANRTTQATWEAKMKSPAEPSFWICKGFSGAEDTSEGATIITDGFGQKYVSRDNPPSMTVNLKVSIYDWLRMKSTLRGGSYRVFPVTSDNRIISYYNTSTQSFQGFKAKVFMAAGKLPITDETHTTVEVMIMFQSVDEFINADLIVPSWDVTNTLKAAVPVGLEVKFVSASTSVITVDVTDRCGVAVTDLITADFTVADGTNSLTITAAHVADGRYTLTDSGTGVTSGTVKVLKGSDPYTYVSYAVNYFQTS